MNRRNFVAGTVGAVAAARGLGVAHGAPRYDDLAYGEIPANPVAEALADADAGTPLRYEASIDDCEVVGEIPRDLDGAFYRVGGEWYYPPKFSDDAPLNSDGYISMFRVRNGRVDFRGRFVETERLRNIKRAGRQLYGYYRNPYTDDESVRDPDNPQRRTVVNTSPVVHGGKLFALKEDGLPHELDPNTLDTVGPWDFNGGWKSQTFTAHPKIDPVTGDMIAYGYQADGLASDALWIYRIGRNGEVRQEVRTRVPYVSVIHDMALTQKHIIIPFAGYVTGMDRLRNGEIHWGWDKEQPGYIGVLPRDGEARDMRWFKGPLRCMMHTFNAEDHGDRIVLYAPFWDGNFFPFFPNVDGSPFDPGLARAFIRKITLNLNSADDGWDEEILWPMDVVDLGKVDPRVMSLETRYLYTSFADDRLPFDEGRVSRMPRRVVNSYGRFDIHSGELRQYFAGPTHSLQEVTFVPRGEREGEGYLVGIADNLAEHRSEMIIADAERPQEGDIARVILPFRLSAQVHGVWASADELPFT